MLCRILSINFENKKYFRRHIKQETKKTGSCILYSLTEVPSQNMKYNVKQACIFHLILVGITYNLILSIKNGEDGGSGGEAEGVFT